MHSTSPPAEIRLRTDAFDAWAASQGLESDTAAAERIGVSQPQLSRVLAGNVAPGEKFIAALLAATGRKFEQMFEVVK
jgi:transcriptional regulator with XRE-family HTH domain